MKAHRRNRYWLAVSYVALPTMGIPFSACRKGDAAACVNRMLIHKYGLVLFLSLIFAFRYCTAPFP